MLVFLSLFILYASAQNLLDLATTAGLTSIRTAVATNGLDGTLSGPGPFTVFAPTNAAFTAAGKRLLFKRFLKSFTYVARSRH